MLPLGRFQQGGRLPREPVGLGAWEGATTEPVTGTAARKGRGASPRILSPCSEIDRPPFLIRIVDDAIPNYRPVHKIMRVFSFHR